MANVQEGRSILLDCRRSGFIQGKLPIFFSLMFTACCGDITPLRCGAWSFTDRYKHFGVMLLFTKLHCITYQETNLYKKFVGRAGYWVESWIYCLLNVWSLLYLTASLFCGAPWKCLIKWVLWLYYFWILCAHQLQTDFTLLKKKKIDFVPHPVCVVDVFNKFFSFSE